MNNNCKFCEAKEDGLLGKLPSLKEDCFRGFFDDKKCCIATLAPEQYTLGHTLLIYRQFEKCPKDILNTKEDSEKIYEFFSIIPKIADILKNVLEKEDGPPLVKIFICVLCEDQQHLHAHLIPRYSFVGDDFCDWYKNFKDRDELTEEHLCNALKTRKIGGIWYFAKQERNYKTKEPSILSPEKQIKYFNDLGEKLRKEVEIKLGKDYIPNFEEIMK